MTATQAMRLKDMYPSHHFLWKFIFHIFMGWEMHLITAKSPWSPSSILIISHFPIPSSELKTIFRLFPSSGAKNPIYPHFIPFILSFFLSSHFGESISRIFSQSFSPLSLPFFLVLLLFSFCISFAWNFHLPGKRLIKSARSRG